MENKKDVEIIAGCFAISLVGIGAVAAIIAGSIISGWALSVLWGWFVSPLFGLPVLSIPQAIGISLVAGALKSASGKNKADGETKEERTKNTIIAIAVEFLAPIILVGCGAIVRMFI